MFCNSLSSFARSMRSFFAAFTGFCPCFQLLIFFQKVFYRDLVYFFSWPEKFSICGNHFFSMARASSFFFPALIGLIPSSVASMAFAYLERLTAGLNSRVGIFQQGKISPKVARELLSVSFIPASKKEDILHREYPPSLQRSQQP